MIKNKKFLLPGIGYFYANRHAAQFSENRSSIDPPFFTVSFDDKIDSATETTAPQFAEEINTLSQKVTDELLTRGKSHIPGLGLFIKNGQNVNFIVDERFEQSFTFGLQPIVNVSEVDRKFIAPVAVASPLLVHEKAKNINKNFLLYSILATLAIFTLVYFFLMLPSSSVEKSKKDVAITEDKGASKPPTDTTSVLTSPVLEEKRDTVNTQATLESESKEVKNTKCVIITGSFKKAKYTVRMIQRLQNKGYEVYTEETDSTTRVGLKYDCASTDVDTLLAKIRKTIEAKAWVLE